MDASVTLDRQRAELRTGSLTKDGVEKGSGTVCVAVCLNVCARVYGPRIIVEYNDITGLRSRRLYGRAMLSLRCGTRRSIDPDIKEKMPRNVRPRKRRGRREREKDMDLLFLPDNETREALVIVHANCKQRYGHNPSNCTVD